MKSWPALMACALITAACSDHPQPAAPRLGAELLGGDDHIFGLSGAVTVDPSLKDQSGPGAPQSRGNPSGLAKSVGPNVVANQDKTRFPQNETPIALDPNNPSRLLAGANDYRHDLAACGIYASSDGGATWNDVAKARRCHPA